MDNEKAWFVRRVVLSVLFVVVVAVPLYPELFGLDELTPFAQLVAFRPQGLAVALLLALLMLLRRGWRIAAALVGVLALTGGALTAPRKFSDARPAPAGSRVLTIMVANVLGGGADAGDVWTAYVEAKRDADIALRDSDLDWTIIRPGGLTDDAPTGQVELAETVERGQVPRADVAAVIVSALDEPATINRQW